MVAVEQSAVEVENQSVEHNQLSLFFTNAQSCNYFSTDRLQVLAGQFLSGEFMKTVAIFGRAALALITIAAPLYAVNRVVSTVGGAPVLQTLAQVVTRQTQNARPNYQMRATVDWQLMTFRAEGDITIPNNGENLRDAVFFVFANTGGVGGADDKRLNVVIDSVEMNGQLVNWKLDGAVLRTSWANAQNAPVTLHFTWHGVVPRAPAGSGGIMEMMGGLGGDVGGLLGMPTAETEKPKNVDYGLYSYGSDILSLGAFWYPTLAMRQNGRWIDEAPEGLGDVAYAAMSDYDVSFDVPSNVMVVAPGQRGSKRVAGQRSVQSFQLDNVRDCAVLMSDAFVPRSKTFNVGGKNVSVEAFTTQKHEAKADEAIEVAGHALQIYAKRFGPYPYEKFIVAEGPMRSGAGGMEYSGMTAIASMLYDDLGAQLGALGQSLGAGMTGGPMGDFLGDLDKEAYGGNTQPQANEPAETNNPAADMLGGILGEQKQIFDSLLEVTIAHEVAHQWWAIGVGSDSQRAPWLDESLTNYSAMVYFEDRYSAAKAQQMIDLHLKTSYSMGRMLGNADAPVNKRTSQYSGNIQYGAIVYGKGALFYDAARKLIGDAAFFGALRDYYARYDNRVATANDLLSVMENAAPDKKTQLRALYQRWIEGAHGDEDISGGKAMDISDLLGGMMGGMTGE